MADGLCTSMPKSATANAGNARTRAGSRAWLARSGISKAPIVVPISGAITKPVDGERTSASTNQGNTKVQARANQTPGRIWAFIGEKAKINIGINSAMLRSHHASGLGAASKPSVGINCAKSIAPRTTVQAQNPNRVAPAVVAKTSVVSSSNPALTIIRKAEHPNIATSAKLRRSP